MSEVKSCQACKNPFEISSDDFDFYKKVEVPPPTFCPQCRAQRRMSFLNERTLYKRKCDMTGESIISLFPQDAPMPVYSPKAWWSDSWDATEYGQDYDFSKPFFEQFGALLRRVPQFALQNQYTTLIRTEYVNMGTYNKDCYLVFNTAFSEESSYTTFTRYAKNCYDMYGSATCELNYECSFVGGCYKTFYSENCEDCVNVSFSKDLYGCQNCFGCVNLRNQNYYIFNQPYTKETYAEEMKKYDLGSHAVVEEIKQKVAALHKQAPVRYMHGVHNKDVSGDIMFDAKNTFDSFYMIATEDCRYCQFVFYKPARDCYDMTFWGQNATRIYECMGAGDSEDMVKFCFDAWAPGTNIEYSYHIVAPNKNIFGCIGLKNKEYCILNKQYTKEEYEALVPKIKQHMMDMPYVDKLGRVYKYGEFFPSEISLFAYNETLAQSYFPLTKEQIEERGFKWKDREENAYAITVKAADLPGNIKDVPDTILNDVIECEVSKRAFKLTAAELQFYKAMNLPLPRLHPDERHKRRLAKQNPMQLWKRSCANCSKEIETSYSPERPEKVFCEDCYQKEVS
jgi:hypothetical protein